MGGREWSGPYLAYAAAHHRRPEEQLLLDRFLFPGGHMAGFLVWNMRRVAEAKGAAK